MKQILMLFLVFIVSPKADAQQAQVVKVTGNRAMVVYPPGHTPRMGQLLNLGDGIAPSKGSRNHFIGMGAEISSLSYSAAGSSASFTATTIAVDGKYGWNLVDYEVGPRAVFASTSLSGVSATVIQVGAYGDYNLVPNLAGQPFVYGATGALMIGSVGGGSTSYSIMDVQLGGVLKWFSLGSGTTAMRFEALYTNRKGIVSGFSGWSAVGDRTVSGLQILAGLQHYF